MCCKGLDVFNSVLFFLLLDSISTFILYQRILPPLKTESFMCPSYQLRQGHFLHPNWISWLRKEDLSFPFFITVTFCITNPLGQLLKSWPSAHCIPSRSKKWRRNGDPSPHCDKYLISHLTWNNSNKTALKKTLHAGSYCTCLIVRKALAYLAPCITICQRKKNMIIESFLL